MDKHPKKSNQFEFDTNGEMEVQQQIMDSYQSGVVEQRYENEAKGQNVNDENQLR